MVHSEEASVRCGFIADSHADPIRIDSENQISDEREFTTLMNFASYLALAGSFRESRADVSVKNISAAVPRDADEEEGSSTFYTCYSYVNIFAARGASLFN